MGHACAIYLTCHRLVMSDSQPTIVAAMLFIWRKHGDCR